MQGVAVHVHGHRQHLILRDFNFPDGTFPSPPAPPSSRSVYASVRCFLSTTSHYLHPPLHGFLFEKKTENTRCCCFPHHCYWPILKVNNVPPATHKHRAVCTTWCTCGAMCKLFADLVATCTHSPPLPLCTSASRSIRSSCVNIRSSSPTVGQRVPVYVCLHEPVRTLTWKCIQSLYGKVGKHSYTMCRGEEP